MLYRIRLGDWGGDGHNITRDFRVEVNYPFDDLQANYLKNVEKFGFGLDGLAQDYDDNFFPDAWYDALVAGGFKDDGTIEEHEGHHYLFEDGLISVAMFLLGDGLSGFSWSYVEDTATLLFGGGQLKSPDGHYVSAGYGLYVP